MPGISNNAASDRTRSVRDSILRGIYKPEFAGPDVVYPGAVKPQGWYEEKVAASMGYPTLVRHPTGPVGSYMRIVGSPNETPTDQFGQSWSSTAPQWMNVGGEWYNVSRPQNFMGDATMIGGGGIGSYTTTKTQPTPLAAIPGMLRQTSQPEAPSKPLSQTQWAGLKPADKATTISRNMSYEKALEGTKPKQVGAQQAAASAERARAAEAAKKSAADYAKKAADEAQKKAVADAAKKAAAEAEKKKAAEKARKAAAVKAAAQSFKR